VEGDPSQGKDKEVSSEAGGFEHRELNEVSKIVDHKGMWDHYHGCLTRARRGLTVSNGDLKQCTAAVLIMMTYLAWQRPGATANLTMEDYERRRLLVREQEEYMVISDKEYKMGIARAAKIIISSAYYSKLHSYVDILQPLTQVTGGEDHLLLLPSGKSIQHANSLIQQVGHKYHLNVPTTTTVRKIGATEAAQKVSGPTATLIGNQLCHSVDMDHRFYQAIREDEEAVTAFQAIESLRSAEPSSSHVTG
jgi:hypothetical protein